MDFCVYSFSQQYLPGPTHRYHSMKALSLQTISKWHSCTWWSFPMCPCLMWFNVAHLVHHHVLRCPAWQHILRMPWKYKHKFSKVTSDKTTVLKNLKTVPIMGNNIKKLQWENGRYVIPLIALPCTICILPLQCLVTPRNQDHVPKVDNYLQAIPSHTQTIYKGDG